MRLKIKKSVAPNELRPHSYVFVQDNVRNKYRVKMYMIGNCQKRYEIYDTFYERYDNRIARGTVRCLGIGKKEFDWRIENPPKRTATKAAKAEYIVLKDYDNFEKERRKQRIAQQQKVLDEALAMHKSMDKYAIAEQKILNSKQKGR